MRTHISDPFKLVELIIEHAPVGMAVINIDGSYLDVNPEYCLIYGYTHEEMLGKSFTMVFEESRREFILNRHQDFLRNGGSLNGEWDVIRRDGKRLCIISESVAIEAENGEKLRLVYVIDITQRKMAERALQQSESLFRTLASVVPVGIFRTDAQGDCIYVNDRWCEIAGLEAAVAMGQGWLAGVHPEDRSHVQVKWYEAAQLNQPFSDEYRFSRKDDGFSWVLCRAVAEYNDAGEVQGFVGTITDISERKKFESELVLLATTDFLTGLASRRSFMAALDNEVARLQRQLNPSVSLIMLDLDHFKRINDVHGHATGDAILKHFAEILRSELRSVDLAGRLGGEEFGVVLPGAGLEDAKMFAERLCLRIATSPLLVGETHIYFTASIGVSECKASDQKSDHCLARVDRALYQAKKEGRNRVQIDL
jgi:diguanylate cyclase (GGDEF)-like protein/PAS domain S-box-containing protein